jgi:hypothetical protein
MANPLTLIMQVLPGTNPLELAKVIEENRGALDAGLAEVGTVHYARTLFLDASSPNLQPGPGSRGPFLIAVITEYDGDFNAYIQDFVNAVGNVFNALLQFVVGGAAVTPVQQHVKAFTAFIAQNDASQHAPNEDKLYQAYPQTVQQILAAFPPS